MKKSILFLSMGLFTLCLFAQTTKKASINNVDQELQNQQEKDLSKSYYSFEKSLSNRYNEIDSLETQYSLTPSESLLNTLNQKKQTLRIDRFKGRIELLEKRYKATPNEELKNEINNNKNTLNSLLQENKSNN